jgi:hypothetical protein
VLRKINYLIIITFTLLCLACDLENERQGTTYTLSFNSNGASGQAPSSRTAEAGANVTLPNVGGLTRGDARFGGWNTLASGDGTNFAAGSSFNMPGNDIVLYAFWNTNTASFIVSFDSNGGSGTPPSAQNVQAGSSMVIPSGSGLTRSGFTFGGWNINTTGTGANHSAGSSFTPTGNITLHARWIDASLPELTGNITITETAQVGQTLTANTNNLGGSGAITFQWMRSGTTTIGTNSSTYTVQDADVGSSITVVVTRSGNTGSVTSSPTATVTHEPIGSVADFTNRMSWLQTNAQSGGNYILEINANLSIAPQILSFSNRNNITITLRGLGANRTISLSSNGSLFDVRSGVALVLDNNITLQGHSNNLFSLVHVSTGGTLIMNTGARISGNYNVGGAGGVTVSGGTFTMNGGTITNNNGRGSFIAGGVHVTSSGTFTMNSGTISSNTFSGISVSNSTFTMINGSIYDNGRLGGVFVSSSIFIMSGGTISGNEGGGVNVSASIFTMSGGTISGNFAENGGGVNISASTFTMTGGMISGNDADYGGGVNVVNGGTFTMSGGAIYNNRSMVFGGGVSLEDPGIVFTKTGGTITGFGFRNEPNGNVVRSGSNIRENRGHAVFMGLDFDEGAPITIHRRETTAGSEVNMDSRIPGRAGGWEN